MRTIRRGVFETNSSSTHSIAICALRPGDKPDTLPVEEDGSVHIYRGEFGWEEETYRDAATKASYCLTYAESDINKLSSLERVILANVPGSKSVVFENQEKDAYGIAFGYIDHQSDDVCSRAFENDEALRDFIFSRNSELHTDNDNN